MADEQEQQAQGAQQAEGGQEPDYKAMYEASQAELEKTKAYSRKHEAQAKSNAEKAKLYDEAQTKARSVEERLAALESENKALRDARDRADVVARVAKATGLDAATVSMLNGADEDQLTEQATAVRSMLGPSRRYPQVTDQAPATGGRAMTEEEIAKIKDPTRRIRARAEAIHNSK